MVAVPTHTKGRAEAAPEPPPAGAPTDAHTRGRPTTIFIVALLASAAALWAVIASTTAFPYLGIDHDEAVYLLQADTFRAGTLFPPAPEDPDVARSMLPWLTAQRGDVYVPKYSPAWPAVLALSREATGSYQAAQALVAAGVVVITYLLALELSRERATAVVAAAFVVLSPFFLLQSPTFLAYLPNLLLLETFAFLFVRAFRTESRTTLALAGFVLGVGFFTRPFDALVFAVPFGLCLVVTRRRTLRRLASELGVLALGAMPALVATLLYFRAATGNPLRSPFFLDERDTLGFGGRRIFPGQPLLDYGAPEALHGFTGHWTLLTFWCFGGLVLIALALLALRRASVLERWFALVAVAVPVGYLLFWGTYLMTQWEGPWRIGPFYYLPVLVPLAVLGAKGFVRFCRWDRVLAALTFAGMLAVSGSVTVRALDHQVRRTEGLRRLHAPLEAVSLERAVVFLPGVDPEQLLNPFTHARNASFGQPVLWAVDRGGSRNAALLEEFPGRAPHLLEEGDSPELRPMTRVRGKRIALRVIADPVGPRAATLELIWQGERLRLPVGGRREAPVVLTAAGMETSDPDATVEPVRSAPGEVLARLLVAGKEVAAGRMSVTVEGGALDTVVPALPRTEREALDVVAEPGQVPERSSSTGSRSTGGASRGERSTATSSFSSASAPRSGASS